MSGQSPVTVGFVYPARYHADPAEVEVCAAAARAVDERVEVIIAEFEDDSERRTRRSRPSFERTDADVDELDPLQQATFARIDVALALDLPFDIAELAPRLRWVQAVGAGVGQLHSSGLGAAGIRLTSASGTSAPEIAEFVMARLLEHFKRLPELHDAQRSSLWRPVYGRPLSEQTVGLVGFGEINQAVARLATAFGMEVLVTRRTRTRPTEGIAAVYTDDQLHEMLPRCDAVVSAVPETASTEGIFDDRAFSSMRPGVYFCNVGRGTAVVDSALLEALDRGVVAAAALDVFDEEPLPPENPYWSHPSVRLSAHCSSVPSVSIRRVHELFTENLQRYLDGEPLLNEVDANHDPRLA